MQLSSKSAVTKNAANSKQAAEADFRILIATDHHLGYKEAD